MKLSVCMIVKNEEAMLAMALESVIDADEIVVCDTGSTDRTVEIARRYTDKVFTDFTWCDDFSAARNHADSKATGEWILVLDADEQLAPGGMEIIREAIKTPATAIECRVRAIDGVQECYNIRIYRNCDYIKWLKPIHNHLNVIPGDRCEATVIYDYSPAHLDDPDRTIRILEDYVSKNEDAVRERYYLGREYHHRGQYYAALIMLDKYVEVSRFPSELADAFLIRAKCRHELGDHDGAVLSCRAAILVNKEFKEAVEFMATICPDQRDMWMRAAEGCTNRGVLFIREAS